MRLLKIIIIFIFPLTLITSCVPNRKVVYLQDQDKNDMDNLAYLMKEIKDVRIKPKDELYIDVTSSDPNEYNFFKASGGPSISSAAAMSIISYTVDSEGYVRLPVLGNVKIAGLSLNEASLRIEKALENYLQFPSVVIKFINRQITVLGEVGAPGTYNYSGENINIFQALGYARDLRPFANRKKIVILRTDGVEITKIRVDLTNEFLLEDENYFLKDDDIVYVPPLKLKYFGFENVPFSLMLQLISSTVLVYTFVDQITSN